LLHILGGLAEPSSGTVLVDGQDINRLGRKAQGDLRNQVLGFVYQFHHLLMEFTALENVAMPLLIRRTDPKQALDQADRILRRVGLGHRIQHKPGELSGGERQRAAVARAMVTRPKCILADEPTGNLDARTADSIHDLMIELNQESDTSLVVVTHDMDLAQKMGRVVRIEDGTLVEGD
jgi:lipoprotein-releasing system ATP-binding protein